MKSASALLGLVLLAGTETGFAQTPQPVERAWRSFRDALRRNDKQQIAAMTAFPFTHPASAFKGRGLSKQEFMAAFDRIFTAGMRKQVAKGSLHAVTKADIRQAREDGADACGAPGDYVLWLSEDDTDFKNDDEAFLHLVLRVVNGRLTLIRVIGCN